MRKELVDIQTYVKEMDDPEVAPPYSDCVEITLPQRIFHLSEQSADAKEKEHY